MYGILSPGDKVSTHFLRALSDIRAGERRKIECAPSALVPQSSDFLEGGSRSRTAEI